MIRINIDQARRRINYRREHGVEAMKRTAIGAILVLISSTLVGCGGGSGDGDSRPASLALFAGHLGGPGTADGRATDAQFARPFDVAVDGVGNLFVADTGNRTIRRIAPTGDVTTFAGVPRQTGSEDGSRAQALFGSPNRTSVDGA